MSSEDLRSKNASLHDKIEQVLEMHPELRELTEAKALSQDLYVEMGAPFLQRTQGKLRERARTIIQHRPELAFHFQGLPLTETPSGNASPEAKLIEALEAHMALRVQAEELIAACVAPESDPSDSHRRPDQTVRRAAAARGAEAGGRGARGAAGPLITSDQILARPARVPQAAVSS
jgi:hypothetical protein